MQLRGVTETELLIEYTNDVSEEGLFVRADEKRAVGSRVQVDVTTRDGAQVSRSEQGA